MVGEVRPNGRHDHPITGRCVDRRDLRHPGHAFERVYRPTRHGVPNGVDDPGAAEVPPFGPCLAGPGGRRYARHVIITFVYGWSPLCPQESRPAQKPSGCATKPGGCVPRRTDGPPARTANNASPPSWTPSITPPLGCCTTGC